jgi:hypothetical protein
MQLHFDQGGFWRTSSDKLLILRYIASIGSSSERSRLPDYYRTKSNGIVGSCVIFGYVRNFSCSRSSRNASSGPKNTAIGNKHR